MVAAQPELAFHGMSERKLRRWVEANPGRVNDEDMNPSTHYTPLFVAVAFHESLALALWLLDEKGADVNRGADPTRRTSRG